MFQRGAPPLSRSSRQGGDFDFLSQIKIPALSRKGRETRTGHPLVFSRSRDRLSGFLVRGPTTFGFPLIPELFTLGECKFYFHSTIFEVHARRNQRQTLLLGLADQLTDLFFVHQQLPGPERGVIVDVAMLVFADMAVQQP